MRYLILGALGKGALEHYYIRGLQKLGVDVDVFDITDDYYRRISQSIIHKVWNKVNPGTFYLPINQKLEQFIDKKLYDIIIVFKGMMLFPSTIQLLKQHARLLCCYNPDHPFKFFTEGSGNKNILNSIKLYDIYFTYSGWIAKELKSRFNVNAAVVPFGYDDEYVIEKKEVSPAAMQKWLFIGSYDKERAAFIDALGVDDILIYGDNKWKTRTNNSQLIQHSYQGRALYDEEYNVAISTGQGIFNLMRRQNIEEQSHNMRTFEVPGYGGLLIANRTEEQMQFFKENEEAIYFDNVEELKSKLHFFAQHPNKINRIKQAALERSQKSGYGYTYRARELHSLSKKHLS